MDRPRLTYFDMRGRAEAIRLFLRATQTEFEDHRVVSRDEWAALKPKLPFGVLPACEVGGVLLCESHAILRYLGRVLAPVTRDELGSAELDVAHDAIAESQDADSERFRTRIPSEAEQRIRGMANTRSDGSRTLIPSEAEHG